MKSQRAHTLSIRPSGGIGRRSSRCPQSGQNRMRSGESCGGTPSSLIAGAQSNMRAAASLRSRISPNLEALTLAGTRVSLWAMNWATAASGFDEVFDGQGQPRPHYAALISILESFTREDVDRRERLQKLALMNQGITFTVYGEKDGLERIFPFDFVPRIIPASEWKTIQDGLVQRITTLNLFLLDVYQEQRCLKDGVIPAELVLSRREYKRELLGLTPPRKIFTHVVGTDLIRNETGENLVLEDNCRCPSGVSYVLENRVLLNRVFPEFFASYPVRPVKEYPTLLLDTLLYVAPRPSQSPVVRVPSRGMHNSAYLADTLLPSD